MANVYRDWNGNIIGANVASSAALCSACFGYHNTISCPSIGSYSFKVSNVKEDGMAYSNGSVVEVVLITEDEDGEAQVAFGPKAYATPNATAAIAKATGDFVAEGGDASKVVNALTRFFG